MISRRPNLRASIENAPGPRMMTAIRIVIARTAGTYDSNRVRVQAGINESLMPAAHNPTATPANGVRKPTESRAPNA